MILEKDLKDQTDNLIVLYAEQPSPMAFGEPPLPASARVRGRDPRLKLAAARALAVTWRDWLKSRPGRP